MTIDEIVLLFEAKRVGAAWMACCPAHQDTNPSLSIAEGDDGRVLLKCQTGCSTEAVLAAMGLTFADLFRDSAGEGAHHAGVHSNTRTVGLTLEEYAAAKKLPADFLRTLGVTTISLSGIKAVKIPYFDASGREVAAQLRLALDGRDRFRWTKGSKPQPYGQQRLADARSAGHVALVEGPSDTQTLWHHGIPALGLPSASTWKSEWDELLDGIGTVFVVVEPDAGGRAVLSWLNKVGFRNRVKLLMFEGVKDPSALYLKDPEGFLSNWKAVLHKPQPWAVANDDDRAKRAKGAYQLAETLLKAPDLFDRIRSSIRKGGYAGELNVPLLVYIAITTRLLQSPLNLAVVAPSGAGKNHAVDAARALVPAEAIHMVSAASERALIYSHESFTHRVVVFAEADSIPDEGPAASAIRSIVTDGKMVYEVVERNPKTGKYETRRIEKIGPTALITTSTRSLGHQMSTRVLEVSLSDEPGQTKQIMFVQARRVQPSRVEKPNLDSFIALQHWLELAGEQRVSVPFADDLARLVPSTAVRMRRDFPQLLTTVQGIAFLMQAQRNRTPEGWVEATLDDYAIARELLAPIFDVVVAESVTPAVRATVEAVEISEELSVTRLAERLGITKSTASYRVDRAVRAGWLINAEDKKGRPAKIRRGEPLPEPVNALPTVAEIRGVFECSNDTAATSPLPPVDDVSDASASEESDRDVL